MSPKALNNNLYAGVKIVVGEVVVKLDLSEFTLNTRSEANIHTWQPLFKCRIGWSKPLENSHHLVLQSTIDLRYIYDFKGIAAANSFNLNRKWIIDKQMVIKVGDISSYGIISSIYFYFRFRWPLHVHVPLLFQMCQCRANDWVIIL